MTAGIRLALAGRLVAVVAWSILGLLPWGPGPARAAEPAIPFLSGRVVDEAEVLGEESRASLAEHLKAHEEKTGNQIAVLTVRSLEGSNVEDYAVAVFKEWKLGQAGKDNGVLFVVAPTERRMRIEVGYGLEGTLTDGTTGRVIRDVITPRFQGGDYDRGISEGVDAVVGILEGGEVPPAGGSANGVEADGVEAQGPSKTLFTGPDLPLSERILFGGFIFGIIGLFTVIGILTPGVGWFLYFFLIPFWALFPIVIVGTHGALTLLVTYLVAFPIAKLTLRRTAWYRKAQVSLKHTGKASIGGFTLTSGGSGSSWSSGSSSSSSSFSGGGGSSGGGGASGSW
jgi:uncharacterized protein